MVVSFILSTMQSRKVFINAFLFSLGFFLIIKIPVRPFLEELGFEKNLYWVAVTAKFIMILLYVRLLVRKFKLFHFGGFGSHTTRNYWMAFIPLLYPTCWAYNSITGACTSDMQFFLLAFLVKLIMASGEEFVFRGIVQGYLIKNAKTLGYHKIMLLTSSLFALGHLLNLTDDTLGNVVIQVVWAFLVSMLLCAVQFGINN